MYGETGYHGAYAANNSEAGSGMHRSPSQSMFYAVAQFVLDAPRSSSFSSRFMCKWLMSGPTSC